MDQQDFNQLNVYSTSIFQQAENYDPYENYLYLGLAAHGGLACMTNADINRIIDSLLFKKDNLQISYKNFNINGGLEYTVNALPGVLLGAFFTLLTNFSNIKIYGGAHGYLWLKPIGGLYFQAGLTNNFSYFCSFGFFYNYKKSFYKVL